MKETDQETSLAKSSQLSQPNNGDKGPLSTSLSIVHFL